MRIFSLYKKNTKTKSQSNSISCKISPINNNRLILTQKKMSRLFKKFKVSILRTRKLPNKAIRARRGKRSLMPSLSLLFLKSQVWFKTRSPRIRPNLYNPSNMSIMVSHVMDATPARSLESGINALFVRTSISAKSAKLRTAMITRF